MKLIRCHVENYGKLQNFDYEFNTGLNTILQENGWGKTTFCSFIKAMLFGLPVSTKKDLDENERMKYTPWQTGNFGGWLEFELKGKSYRIERFWGDKQSKDKARLVDLATNQELANPNIVEETLKINAETFERSTFVPHNFSSKIKNESIKEKLRKLLDNIETDSVEKICVRLDEMESEIEHRRGKGGKLWELTQKQDYLENEISECEKAKLDSLNLQKEIEVNAKKIEEINEKVKEQGALLQAYNDSRVEQEKIKSIQKSIDEVEQLKKEIASIEEFFKNSPPDEQTLNQLNKTLNELKSMENTLETLKNSSVAKNVKNLNDYFKSGVPSDDELTQIKQTNARLIELNSAKLTPTQAINKISKKKLLLLCGDVLAIVLALVGIIGLIITQNPILFTPITLIGVLLGSLSFYFTFHTPETEITPTQIDLNRKKRTEQTELNEKVGQFVARFEPNSINYTNALVKIETKKQMLEQYKNDQLSQSDQLSELERRVKLNQDFLNNYLSNFYSAPLVFSQCIIDLTKKIQRYELLKEQLVSKQASLPELAVPQQSVPQVEIDINKLQAETSKLEREKDQLSQANAQSQTRLDALLTQASAKNSLQFELSETIEEITKLNHNLRLIQQTREFLKNANANLTSKYLSPITDSFVKYSKLLSGEMFKNIAIDTDLNVTIENYGEQKKTQYFSLGSRDIIDLCLRLSLTETLFNEELPPLILDDTFSNLDDAKTTKALGLLKKITDKFQIIYLVCHSSRA